MSLPRATIGRRAAARRELELIVLAALPPGSVAGCWLGIAIAKGNSSELYQIPSVFDPFGHGFAASFAIGLEEPRVTFHVRLSSPPGRRPAWGAAFRSMRGSSFGRPKTRCSFPRS